MWRRDAVLAALRGRGELWEAGPGLIGMRGETLALYRAIERAIGQLAAAETDDDWQVPAAIGLETLDRAAYFASFPQWLTLASHLSDDSGVLEQVATARDPAAAARGAVVPAEAALAPAVCYHVYAGTAGRVVRSPTLVTAQGLCWRHEGARFAPMERGWAFAMREIVCLGTPDEAAAFAARGRARALALARALGLESELTQAEDPFFAPTARGRALLQRVKALKHELVVPLGPDGGGTLAVASVNHHESFFGDAFGIRLADGTPACTACVAFGIERWVLAFLLAHGPDAAAWPPVDGATAVA